MSKYVPLAFTCMAYRFYLVHWRHEDAEPEAIEEDGRNPEQDEEDADQDQGDDPEPYDEVHLLVDDVLGQDAEAVVVLVPIQFNFFAITQMAMAWKAPIFMRSIWEGTFWNYCEQCDQIGRFF